MNYKDKGIQIICDNDIIKNSILVTSRYTEDSIREECERKNILLLPKGLAVFVKINIEKNNQGEKNQGDQTIIKNIFLDDDLFIRLGWESAAYGKHKNLFKREYFLY